MNTAQDLFETLKAFRETDGSGRTPQTQLLDYCHKSLGSVEGLHYDFKAKSDASNPDLSDSDREHLAKAISGFANTGGGVLIWGIEDKTMAPQPISNAPAFLESLLSSSHQVTDPIVAGIDGAWIRSDSPTGRDGFALVCVPESLLPPHRVTVKSRRIQNHYYTRIGESFVIASHTQLEDWFGRRPHPNLRLCYRILADKVLYQGRPGQVRFRIIYSIENSGRGLAKYPYLSVQVDAPYEVDPFGIDGNRGFGLPRLPVAMDKTVQRFGGSANIVIYPGMLYEVFAVSKQPPDGLFTLPVPPLVVRYTLAAEGVQSFDGIETITGEQLYAAAEGSK